MMADLAKGTCNPLARPLQVFSGVKSLFIIRIPLP